MKISKARLNEIIKEELADILSEIKAEDIGLDSKKDTTEADDDLLGLISKKELAANKDYAIILKNGYIPVNRFGVDKDAPAKGEHLTAKLGRSGAFGTAYEATKAGTNKRFAVKLTSDGSELKVRRKLEQLRDKVGNEVSKHIVKVYDIIEAKGEPARQPGTGTSGGELKEADKPFDAGRLQGTVPGRRSAFLKDLPMKHMIVMQLVRPMNDFEDKLLYDGMGSLERLLTSYKIKEIAGNWELFLNLLKGRIDEDGFDFAAALAAIVKSAPKRSTPVDRDIYTQFKFHETVANQLLTVCREQSARLRNIWKDSFKDLSIGEIGRAHV